MAATTTTTARPKVVLTRASLPSTLLKDAADAGLIDLVAYDDSASQTGAPRDWLLQNARDAHALIVFLTDAINEELIEAAGPQLRCVSTMSVGLDHVDVKLLQERGIRIGYTPKVLDSAVAELSLMLALMSTRNVPRALGAVSRGEWGQNPWTPMAFCGPSLKGKTIGFYGFGAIAQSIVLLLPTFQPSKVLYTTSSPTPFDPALKDARWDTLRRGGWRAFSAALSASESFSPIEIENVPDVLDLAAQSDVLFVMASLNSSTKPSINADVFARMRPTAHLINTSRGPLVDTEALVDALRRGQIAGAALDVLEGEPNIPASHPLLTTALAEDDGQRSIRERVVLLPHIGSATNEARRDMADWAASNALAALEVEGHTQGMPAEYRSRRA
ncbi:hypothetical protein V8E36_006519 [Tilletia maclaganii]